MIQSKFHWSIKQQVHVRAFDRRYDYQIPTSTIRVHRVDNNI